MDETLRWLLGPNGVSGQRASFTQADLVEALLAGSDGTARHDAALAADEVLRSGAVVPLLPSRAGTPLRYSTPELLAGQRDAVADAVARRGAGVGVASAQALERAMLRRSHLSPEDVVAVRDLTTSGAGVDVVVHDDRGHSLTVLEAAAAAWSDDGPRVMAAAPSDAAAAEVAQATRTAACTVQELLDDAEYPRAGGGGPRGFVVIVADAHLVSDRDTAGLVTAASESDAKLVLAGDPGTLTHAEPTTLFTTLAARVGLTTVVGARPHLRPWQRDATDLQLDADPAPARGQGHADRLTAERAWLGRRITQDRDRLQSLYAARDATPQWRRAHRRDIDDRIETAETALRAATNRADDLDRAIRGQPPGRRRAAPAQLEPAFDNSRSDRAARGDERVHHRDGTPTDDRGHPR